MPWRAVILDTLKMTDLGLKLLRKCIDKIVSICIFCCLNNLHGRYQALGILFDTFLIKYSVVNRWFGIIKAWIQLSYQDNLGMSVSGTYVGCSCLKVSKSNVFHYASSK